VRAALSCVRKTERIASGWLRMLEYSLDRAMKRPHFQFPQ
jgi:hypothetical protein